MRVIRVVSVGLAVAAFGARLWAYTASISVDAIYAGLPGVLLPALAVGAGQDTNDSRKIAHALQVEYVNRDYRFRIALPDDWKGFSIVKSTWEGDPMEKRLDPQTGPLITIRHPLWTEERNYQDIPIMVFTTQQWSHVDDFAYGPAPVGPGKIGSNAKFVFAVPARWVGYAEDVGWREVALWMQTNPLHGY